MQTEHPASDGGEARASAGAVESYSLPVDTAGMNNRDRFVAACQCRPLDRPPVWLMRQAGRCLPEYRALKERLTFLELVQDPSLAAEVTLQPIRRFDFDAAIIFSDILVVPEAMGQRYQFREQGGVKMEQPLDSFDAIERLQPEGVVERLQYVREALLLCRKALESRTALIGFSGSPWTLANFMLEGGSAEEFTRAKQLFYTQRKSFDRLCEKLTFAITEYLKMQIAVGVDAVQIFDSLGGILAGADLQEASLRWVKEIIRGLEGKVPVILFSKGAHGSVEALSQTGANILGADWTVPLAEFRDRLPTQLGVQGNLDPCLLNTTPAVVRAATTRLLEQMRGRHGHIFNLGHGVPPTATLENIEALVGAVHNFV